MQSIFKIGLIINARKSMTVLSSCLKIPVLKNNLNSLYLTFSSGYAKGISKIIRHFYQVLAMFQASIS